MAQGSSTRAWPENKSALVWDYLVSRAKTKPGPHPAMHESLVEALSESSMSQLIRGARLQNEVGTKYIFSFFWRHEFLHEKCSQFFPKFCGSEKIPPNSHQISREMSLPKLKKIHRRDSAGAQREQLRYREAVFEHGALLNRRNGRGGMRHLCVCVCARHLCGKSVRARTSHNRDPCLPLNQCGACAKIKAHYVIGASLACHRETRYAPVWYLQFEVPGSQKRPTWFLIVRISGTLL